MNNNRYYWPESLDSIFIEYNSLDNIDDRSRLYSLHLHNPLLTLVDCLMAKYANKDSYDIFDDVLMHLILKIENYNGASGRSFSYFTVIAKHYIWQYNQTIARDIKRYVRIDGLEKSMTLSGVRDREEYPNDDLITGNAVKYPEQLKIYPPDDIPEPNKLLEYIKMTDTCGGNKDRDKKIVRALRSVLHNLPTDPERVHKKAILQMIRDMTDCKTVNIKKTINRIKKNYQKSLI